MAKNKTPKTVAKEIIKEILSFNLGLNDEKFYVTLSLSTLKKISNRKRLDKRFVINVCKYIEKDLHGVTLGDNVIMLVIVNVNKEKKITDYDDILIAIDDANNGVAKHY